MMFMIMIVQLIIADVLVSGEDDEACVEEACRFQRGSDIAYSLAARTTRNAYESDSDMMTVATN
jgi:hypothetical protein